MAQVKFIWKCEQYDYIEKCILDSLDILENKSRLRNIKELPIFLIRTEDKTYTGAVDYNNNLGLFMELNIMNIKKEAMAYWREVEYKYAIEQSLLKTFSHELSHIEHASYNFPYFAKVSNEINTIDKLVEDEQNKNLYPLKQLLIVKLFNSLLYEGYAEASEMLRRLILPKINFFSALFKDKRAVYEMQKSKMFDTYFEKLKFGSSLVYDFKRNLDNILSSDEIKDLKKANAQISHSIYSLGRSLYLIIVLASLTDKGFSNSLSKTMFRKFNRFFIMYEKAHKICKEHFSEYWEKYKLPDKPLVSLLSGNGLVDYGASLLSLLETKNQKLINKSII